MKIKVYILIITNILVCIYSIHNCIVHFFSNMSTFIFYLKKFIFRTFVPFDPYKNTMSSNQQPIIKYQTIEKHSIVNVYHHERDDPCFNNSMYSPATITELTKSINKQTIICEIKWDSRKEEEVINIDRIRNVINDPKSAKRDTRMSNFNVQYHIRPFWVSKDDSNDSFIDNYNEHDHGRRNFWKAKYAHVSIIAGNKWYIGRYVPHNLIRSTTRTTNTSTATASSTTSTTIASSTTVLASSSDKDLVETRETTNTGMPTVMAAATTEAVTLATETETATDTATAVAVATTAAVATATTTDATTANNDEEADDNGNCIVM